MADRPLIGVTGPAKRLRVGWWATRLMLGLSGAVACYLTAEQPRWPRALNALVIGGGDDIHPESYGMGSETKARYDPQRDTFELGMLRRALDAGIPVLGICRGSQLLNIAHGGTLVQDIRFLYQDSPQRTSVLPTHGITIEANSRLSSLINVSSCRVNNLHHQAVERCGRGLVAVAHDEHGIIEGIESANGTFILGVQWHPEYMPYRGEQRALFSGLVKAAQALGRQLPP